MHDDDVYDHLTAIDMSRSATKAEEFEELAGSMPVGENGRATFLLAAGQHRQMRKEYEEARRLFELALEDGGDSGTEPLANLHSLALDTGDDAAAESLSKQLRVLVREGDLGADSCHFVGDTLRSHGRLREALRWFTIPLTWADEDDELDDLCLVSRYHVRRELGMAEDRFDQIAAAEIEFRSSTG
ncbi:hypothetical protein [Nocardioides sp. LS1]|uniref:hypothetical protein n=1 Tax=Nocardioides sp. LS1 TaxID=1027620 RepID=UPI000F61CACB|nr:hypothetical protein [Nocardioides sp. LS1]GCD91463.1 hypothetical protein NLS1_34690 [Nocardioides sp. LS1]